MKFESIFVLKLSVYELCNLRIKKSYQVLSEKRVAGMQATLIRILSNKEVRELKDLHKYGVVCKASYVQRHFHI